MKKNLLFFVPTAIVAVLLFLLRFTGMPAHIGISVAGVVIMVVLTLLTKKDWRIPALEILMRALYLVALITGIVLMNAYSAPLSIAHKASAALFAVLLVVIFVHKLLAKKK